LPFVNATDLQPLRQIRLRIKADAVRLVRVELDSPSYRDSESGVRFGWDVLARSTPIEVTLTREQLGLPQGESSQDGLGNILPAVTAIVFSPEARGRNDAGLLPSARADRGFVEVDDILVESP
jgi:hypothetical protein